MTTSTLLKAIPEEILIELPADDAGIEGPLLLGLMENSSSKDKLPPEIRDDTTSGVSLTGVQEHIDVAVDD
ncbi:MAG: hypothetical protein COT88_02195 [Candidatus Colwellbacteria bacterium CG10_big_fil_rev_8_21_14_0_10_41_28]|uniref:Uncharacterized protein n=1 Tax=Candidatus Colwellbacteria bacterium CG10_big_fil_rev_8_21_14_0_10_41_28 TaxID=1974539 RepID=A0A2H0VGR2_9BACT|nr:MAG: hypothetical protein COT88_02195 [Candidatus Colwellbacteria bacterium CG10_big_fil_rev_8_21_14_0_10_41_28]